MKLSKEAAALLKRAEDLDKQDSDTIYVSKAWWVQVLTIIHKLAVQNENKNLGNKRPISRTESAVRKKRIRAAVVDAVEPSSSGDRRGPDSGKRS